jgi:hypothetical protein
VIFIRRRLIDTGRCAVPMLSAWQL